ncbi:prephenate dehydrogenase [Terriglobus sp.]|uniref:prephenate dehydrogenase n=1 Tax=Terriglobus sp. TaxID=1889013 RepID=UPI003B007BA6
MSVPAKRITIIGTGLIGASIGLALRDAGYTGLITGIDRSADELRTALDRGAITHLAQSPEKQRAAISRADLIILAVPVLGILQWMEQLAPLVHHGQLVTDAGSTKLQIAEAARRLLPGRFLPGHPMAGKESGGAALAEAALFRGATWLFTPDVSTVVQAFEASATLHSEWRNWVERFGANVLDMPADRHDEICAWVSHLPQMVSTALSALLEDTFGNDADLRSIGGRALREMTRLGSSPFSMWRDVAHTNQAPLAHTLLMLEQRLQHLRENLRTPALRDEFSKANDFRRSH